jgi:hypothetical protein
MGRRTGQWQCRICGLDRWHVITVKRKNGALYTTSFYACSRCSAMFLNPEQFNAVGNAAPNVEMPTVHSVAFTMDQCADAWPEALSSAGEKAASLLFAAVGSNTVAAILQVKGNGAQPVDSTGAAGLDRTDDLPLTRRLLYH